ncbi:long-chain fatty acid--CoA ligase [Mycolicibacterium sp. CH28]|uniref:class I adenylate-forming enzyme family protein n=1 Tax=Mycolicibacterium sp. CH28 TaxID=2512237 RepID=UPI00108085D6|nr:AMP-binding protein [Mycolicibacterium sp. CH28]TGD83915.1 long-chain fatty acid--CoA ligase [Mycolicibacterium sp. CH28]
MRRPWDYVEDFGDRPPPWRRLLVERILRQTAQRSPNSQAIISGDRVTTWAELDVMANRAANGLARLNARPGDVVALSAANSAETLAMMFGMARAGLIALPINTMNRADEIDHQLHETGAIMMLSAEGLTAEEVIANGEPEPPRVDVDELSPFWIRFTSGTTGRPRGYAVSHRAVSLMIQQMAIELRYDADDTLLVNAPLAHAAFAFAGAIVATGATMVLAPFDAEHLWQDCQYHGVTQLFMVPTMLAMALQGAGAGATVRQISLAGSALTPSLRQRAVQRFPHIDFTELYGASELGMLTVLHSRDAAERVGSVGLPRFGYDVRILDDDGHDVPPGVVGTVFVQGPSLSDGPVGSVSAPANVVRDGWVTSGDMGRVDNDGFLYLADRRSDLIVSGGLNVYPAEVENVLQQVDDVGEVVVVGFDDEVWGQRVTAVLTGHAPDAVLDAHCRQMLAGYKIPRSYVRVDELPKTASGKLKRGTVRELLRTHELSERHLTELRVKPRVGEEVGTQRVRRSAGWCGGSDGVDRGTC